MVICIQKHPNELYMVTTPPFIHPMNVYVLTAIMTKKAVLTVKPICALTEQISAVFETRSLHRAWFAESSSKARSVMTL